MKRPKKRRKKKRIQADDSFYICDACGEEIVIPLDPSQGSEQKYVEDCPVCCRPNVIHVEFDEQGESRVWAERE
jgi:DNA replicative helicase MCM subunit Mcm2 (Cdc46/Mcm family)